MGPGAHRRSGVRGGERIAPALWRCAGRAALSRAPAASWPMSARASSKEHEAACIRASNTTYDLPMPNGFVREPK